MLDSCAPFYGHVVHMHTVMNDHSEVCASAIEGLLYRYVESMGAVYISDCACLVRAEGTGS